MSEQNLELMRKKVRLYKKSKGEVHVVILNSKKFYNGLILEVKKDFFVIKDKKAEATVFFEEVFKIEPYEKNIN